MTEQHQTADHQRAQRIMEVAMALFGGDGDALDPGVHVRARAGVTVAVDVKDAKRARLMLANEDDKHALFEAHIVAGAAARVTRWEGGPWERRFTAADA